MIKAIPYCGTVTNRLGGSIPTYYVRKLSESINNTERNITCDKWFSLHSLFEMIKKEYNLSLIGTIKKTKERYQLNLKVYQKILQIFDFATWIKKLCFLMIRKKKKFY